MILSATTSAALICIDLQQATLPGERVVHKRLRANSDDGRVERG